MVAKKKSDPTSTKVKEKPPKTEIHTGESRPEVTSLPPAIIDLFARVIINVNQEDVEAYAEIVKEHQEALLRALNRGAWTGSNS